MTLESREFLRKIPLFADLPEADLEALCRKVEEIRLPAGKELFAEGAPGDRAYIVKDGQLEVVKVSSGREVLLAVQGPQQVIGELALLENKPRMASVRARSDATLIAIGKEQLDHLLNTSHAATRALFYTVVGRLRATEAVMRHSERMAQLGVLTAGVAHEMNNPAAAVKRGADQLAKAMAAFSAASWQAARLDLSDTQRQAVSRLEVRAREGGKDAAALDPVERSDRSSALEGWLESNGVEEPWELAPALADWGLDVDGLDKALAGLPPSHLPAILCYVVASGQVHSLIDEISIGTGRLSEIVKALKSYSYLDQAPVQDVDLKEGIENTVVIMGNKLRGGIAVRREYAPDLPRIEAYGSELNQVWTNLIDNAADAMGGKGTLTIRARLEGRGVTVEVEDDGPGIPIEIRPKIFDAFFTTKPPGKGTGLGLNVTYNIVVHRHRGSIEVDSRPGKTVFKVWLPRSLSGKGSS